MASQGYEVLGGDGVIAVDEEHPDAQAHTTTIGLLQTALESGRMELMDIPYSDPDPTGLRQTDREEDLLPQYERGTSAYLAALEATSSASTMLAGGTLTDTLASVMRARGKTIVLIDPASLEDTSAVHADLGQGMTALTIDVQASDALRSGETTTFARAVFEHHLSEDVPLHLRCSRVDRARPGVVERAHPRTSIVGTAGKITVERRHRGGLRSHGPRSHHIDRQLGEGGELGCRVV